MKVKIKEIDEILQSTQDIKVTYNSKVQRFEVLLCGISGEFVVKSIAGRTRDAELKDLTPYLSRPWYLPATWIKEIINE